MTKHIDTRRKLAEIAEVDSFYTLINKTTLTPEDKHILTLHYINGYDLRFIADRLGYSESTIKRRHRKALVKIASLL